MRARLSLPETGPRMSRPVTNRYPFRPLHFQRLAAEETAARAQRLRAQMESRRSVRHFSSEPVPREVVESAIAIAATAPSGAHQQPWTFVLVSDPALKRDLREAAEVEERESYQQRMSEEWLEALAPLGTDWTKPHITDAPWVIVVFEQLYGRRDDGKGGRSKVKHYYVQESVGIAVGFLLMALHLSGLAALTHTPSPMGFLRERLGRPENERPFVLIPVGYPAEGCEVPDLRRKQLDDVLVRL